MQLAGSTNLTDNSHNLPTMQFPLNQAHHSPKVIFCLSRRYEAVQLRGEYHNTLYRLCVAKPECKDGNRRVPLLCWLVCENSF